MLIVCLEKKKIIKPLLYRRKELGIFRFVSWRNIFRDFFGKQTDHTNREGQVFENGRNEPTSLKCRLTFIFGYRLSEPLRVEKYHAFYKIGRKIYFSWLQSINFLKDILFIYEYKCFLVLAGFRSTLAIWRISNKKK